MSSLSPLCRALAIVFTLLIFSSAVSASDTKNFSPHNAIPALLLIAPQEATPLDAQISRSQKKLQDSPMAGPELEKLGWLFIAKARASSDPGFFTLAGIAADTLEQKFAMPQEAWLLRGHVLQTRHRFAEAETLATRLVAERGLAADFALLGDALYDEGRIAEAARAYQQMVDLKPSLDSYARAANIRWIKGDLAGAVQLQTLAVRSGGPGDAGALAWSLCRLGQLVWQQGDTATASSCAGRALELVPDFAPALLLQGRLLLAAHRAAEALVPLAVATTILPFPETRWVYAEALHAAGKETEASAMEERLVREGAAEDPRTVALFLATHSRDSDTAVRLAQAELKTRADVMTHAANALALADAGRIDEALVHSRAALAEGTVDARLLLCAGYAAALARQPNAAALLERASQLAAQLLPSEQRLLQKALSLLPPDASPAGNFKHTTKNNPS